MIRSEEALEMKVASYEEAVELVNRVGILPLAPLAPGHPSLGSATEPSWWHSDTERDPWMWRVKFPGDGSAAYGKFMKKKAVLIAKDWFPLFRTIAGRTESPKKRYADGLLSRAALEVYQCIEANQGIETRELRTMAGMKHKDYKKDFDAAILELQGSVDIVISGVKSRVNELGEKNGWNSTSYETAEYWMNNWDLSDYSHSRDTAVHELKQRLSEVCSEEAYLYFCKALMLR